MQKTDYKIMIVDDEKSLLKMYKIKLEHEGFHVLTSSDGLEALTMITEFLPDLILLDIMMPKMDGFETLGTIRELAPSLKKTKIIIFTNVNTQANIDLAKEKGADDYIVKANTTPLEVVKKIKKMLNIVDDEENSEKKVILCPYCHKDITDKI